MSDNLESYFRKHLRDETPGKDGWNTPSEDVWKNIAPEIAKRPGVFVPWKYFYILGVGLALVIATVLLIPENQNEFQAEKSKITTQKTDSALPKKVDSMEEISLSGQKENKQLETDKTPITHNETLNQSSANIVATIPSTVKPNVVVSTAPDKIPSTEKTTTQTIESVSANPVAENKAKETTTEPSENMLAKPIAENAANPENKPAKTISGTAMVLNQTQNRQSNTQTTITKGENKIDKAGILTTTPSDELAAKSGEPIFIYSDPIYFFPEDPGYLPLKGQDYLNRQKANPIPFSQGKFGIGAYYAPTYSTTLVKGLTLQGSDQMGNTFLFSSNWGFDFYYYLSNRFTIVSGVGSYEIRSWSKTTNQFGYDPSKEHDMGDNQTANGTAQTSPTPFGSLSSEVIFSFSSDITIPDGEIMESVSETFQNIRYLSIPLGMEYNLLNREKSRWFLETGINYNISIRDKTELTPQILHQGDAMNIMESTIIQSPNYENNYWGFYIGTGLKFPVSPRIKLLGTIRYNRSISPLKSYGDATTHVQAYQLKIGVVYLLH